MPAAFASRRAAFIRVNTAPAKRSFARPAGVTRTPPAQGSTLKPRHVARPLKEEFRSALREQSEMKFPRATVFPRAAPKERNLLDKLPFV